MIINTDSQNDNFFFNERISNFLKEQVLQVTNNLLVTGQKIRITRP